MIARATGGRLEGDIAKPVEAQHPPVDVLGAHDVAALANRRHRFRGLHCHAFAHRRNRIGFAKPATRIRRNCEFNAVWDGDFASVADLVAARTLPGSIVLVSHDH